MRTIFLSLLLVTAVSSFAQNDILLTINDESIAVEEFKRVYEKNLSLLKDAEDSSPEDYIDLFVDYKLKVQEAYRLGLDKKPPYIKELASYRRQLAKNHLNDVAVTDELVVEAYNRSVKELRARHILIRVAPDALPIDTLAAYNTLLTARSRILSGEGFEVVAKEVSEDPSVKKNGGDLGWFKAFKMVYPFENAAYSTEQNDISMPFRTDFGYHIVQPTDTRTSKGSVKVAHVMVALKQNDSTIIPEKRINEVAALLKSGASFETLARNYSDDRNSSKKGGILNVFEQGQLSSPVFEAKAFEIEEVGAYSLPFKTQFGWHIVKLLEKNPVRSLGQMKSELTQKVTKDARARVISDKLIQQLRAQYDIALNESVISYFKSFFPEIYVEKEMEQDDTDEALKKTAFTIIDSVYTYGTIRDHLVRRYKRKKYKSRDYFVENEINSFVDSEIKKYHLEHLEEQDPSFKNVLREYREGLLLFDLLESTIWKKAQNDSVGLRKFYNENSKLYKLPRTYEATIFTTKNLEVATVFKAQLLQGLTPEAAVKSLRQTYSDPIILSSRSILDNELPENRKLRLGTSKRFKDEDDYIIYIVTDIKEPRIQSLEEARGLIMSDFQKQLEIDFVQRLRKNNTVSIDRERLSQVVKAYDD